MFYQVVGLFVVTVHSANDHISHVTHIAYWGQKITDLRNPSAETYLSNGKYTVYICNHFVIYISYVLLYFHIVHERDKKQDICLWNTDAPGGNKVKLWQNLYVLHFDPAQPQFKFGYCMTTHHTEELYNWDGFPNFCKSKIEKVPRGIQGEKSRKDTASSVKLV